MSMNKYYISTIDKDKKYINNEVNENVYVYIKQLESYIKHPLLSKLKEVYKDRFNEKDSRTIYILSLETIIKGQEEMIKSLTSN